MIGSQRIIIGLVKPITIRCAYCAGHGECFCDPANWADILDWEL